jgi:acyl carrier protein
VRNRSLDQDLLLSRLKNLVAGTSRLDILDPDRIADDEPLMGGSLCRDSLDALELTLCVEEEFGIAICGGKELHRALTTIANLAAFIHAGAQTSLARPSWSGACRSTMTGCCSESCCSEAQRIDIVFETD